MYQTNNTSLDGLTYKCQYNGPDEFIRPGIMFRVIHHDILERERLKLQTVHYRIDVFFETGYHFIFTNEEIKGVFSLIAKNNRMSQWFNRKKLIDPDVIERKIVEFIQIQIDKALADHDPFYLH